MKNFIKMVMCLCAGIIAVNAMEPIDTQNEVPTGNPNVITFDGNQCVKDCDYIQFNVNKEFENQGFWVITKVSINKDQLKGIKEPKEIVLKIPGFVNSRHISIGERAFQNLNSKYLRIKLAFEPKISSAEEKRVFFPDDCEQMFGDSGSITEIDFSGANLNSITNTKGMFVFCRNLTKINFGDSTTPNLTDMSCMFQGCESLAKLDLRNFDTRKVTNMYRTFYNCATLKELDLSNFNTSNVSNMMYMFSHCEKLKFLNLRKFYTNNVILMQEMFSGCANLEGLDLNNFYISKNAVTYNMFYDCPNLSWIRVHETQIGLFKELILPEAKNAVVYSPKEDNMDKVNIDDFEVIDKPKDDDDEINEEDDLKDEDDWKDEDVNKKDDF